METSTKAASVAAFSGVVECVFLLLLNMIEMRRSDEVEVLMLILCVVLSLIFMFVEDSLEVKVNFELVMMLLKFVGGDDVLWDLYVVFMGVGCE